MPRLKLDPTSPFGVSVAEPVQIPRQSHGYIDKVQYLSQIQDVNITGTPVDDQALAYDTATGKWIPQTLASGGGGATNLAATLSATNTIITSDTGTDATIPATDATNAGVMIPAQKTKLDGIATGATANDTDANLKARANHTGTQTAATISDFSAAADARISNAAGTSIASLSGGKVPTSQLPAVSLTSVQTAISEAAQLALTTQEGDVVVRTDENKTYMRNAGTAGTMADFTLLNTPTDAVTSVNGDTGVVVLDKADVGLGNADNTSDAAKPISTAAQTALDAKAASADLTAHTGATAVHGATGAVVGTTNTQTLSNKTLASPIVSTAIFLPPLIDVYGATSGFTRVSPQAVASGTLTLPATTDTLVGRATTDTLTNKTLSTGSVIDANVTVTEVLKKVYPVGSVYAATVATNPATLLGFGTWSAYGAGRVMVGKAAAGTFATGGATGGAETHTLLTAEMPSHTHVQDAHTHIQNAHTHPVPARDTDDAGTTGAPRGTDAGVDFATRSTTAVNQNATAVNQNTGGGGAHNNLQPYIVTYLWERTA